MPRCFCTEAVKDTRINTYCCVSAPCMKAAFLYLHPSPQHVESVWWAAVSVQCTSLFRQHKRTTDTFADRLCWGVFSLSAGGRSADRAKHSAASLFSKLDEHLGSWLLAERMLAASGCCHGNCKQRHPPALLFLSLHQPPPYLLPSAASFWWIKRWRVTTLVWWEERRLQSQND